MAGSVTTWGDPACGGNSSHVAAHLKSRAFQICYNEWVPWMQQDGFEESDGSVYLQTKAFTAFREGGQLVCLLVASLFHLAKSLWDFVLQLHPQVGVTQMLAVHLVTLLLPWPLVLSKFATTSALRKIYAVMLSSCHLTDNFRAFEVHWCIMFPSFECLSNMELKGTSESLVWHQLLEKVQ